MASEVKTNKVSPATGVALSIGDSGDTITVPSGATLDISASTLTPPATMPASSGVNLTALNATNLGSGTVPTARLGSGTADATTFLRGDQTYAAAGGDATPRWLAYIGTNQSLSSNVDVTYDYDTEVFDSDSAFDTGTNTFTVPVGEAGLYLAFAQNYIQGTNSSAMQLVNMAIHMGSGQFFQEFDTNGNYGKAFSTSSSGIYVLAEGDTIHVTGKSIFYAGTVIVHSALSRSCFGGWRIA